MNKELLNVLGLARKANAIIFGDMMFKNFKQVKYLFIASDISTQSLKRLLNKVEYYQIKYNQDFTSFDLSLSIGKKNIKAIGITNENFKLLIEKKEVIYGKTSKKETES